MTRLEYDDTTNFLSIPASTVTIGSGGGTVDAAKTVETYGAIAELTAANLETLFPNEDDAQPGDLIWVGTPPNEVLYRMQQGSTNARLPASWGRDTVSADTTLPLDTTSTNVVQAQAIAAQLNAIIGTPAPPDDANTLAELNQKIESRTSAKQIELITYRDPDLTSLALEYDRIYYLDLRGTTEANSLTLQLPGAESTVETMGITIRDLPQETFDTGYLRIEALSDGGTAVQILTAQGLTTASETRVSAFSLRGSEIHLARTIGSDRWLMSLRTTSETTQTTQLAADRAVENFGQIAEMSDAALAARFVRTDEAQSGDLIWVGETRYRMIEGAVNAQLAASWRIDRTILPNQVQLITYNNPLLTSQALQYSQTYFIDQRTTTTSDRLTLQLPGAEDVTRTMEIVIRDIPINSFATGYLTLEALPNGTTPVQIFSFDGLTTNSRLELNAYDLRGQEIYLARTSAQNIWLMSLRPPGNVSSSIIVPSGTVFPNDSTLGNIFIYNAPTGTPSRLFVRFTEGWAGLIMPDDFN